jgi:hypothetical protein
MHKYRQIQVAIGKFVVVYEDIQQNDTLKKTNKYY